MGAEQTEQVSRSSNAMEPHLKGNNIYVVATHLCVLTGGICTHAPDSSHEKVGEVDGTAR